MAYVAVVLQSLSHLDFISIIANSVGKNGTMAIATIQAYVSKSKWIIIQQGSACIAVVLGLLFLWFIIKFKYCTNIIYNLFKTIYYDVKKILRITIADKYVFIICMVFLVTHSMYYILHWAIQYDECWTYNYFLTKNIAFSFLTPNNNHNLFTLLCWFALKIPLPVVVAYRLVAMVLGLCSLLAYRKLSSMLFTKNTHLLSLCIYTASLPLLYYSVIARSYTGTVLCATLSLICIFKIAEQKNSQKIYYYFALLQAVGLFFNPIYIYAAFTNYVILFFISNYNIVRIFKSVLVFLICTFLFIGVPLVILNGYKPLLAVAAQNINSPYKIINGGANMLVHYFTGAHYAGFVFWVVLLVFIIAGFIAKNKNLFIVVFALFIPIIACVMQKQILYERIFTYLVPFVVIGFSSLFALFLKQKNANQILGILFLASGAFFYTQHTLFNWNIGKDKAVQETAKLLLDKNIDSLYNYVDYTKPGLEYYYKQANKNLSIEIHNTNSIDYLSFDSTTNYESIIFENKTFNNTHLYKVEKIQNEWTVLLRE